ncbi:MAG: hypothetical protein QOK31_622 [Solirubrobacteraceae bacterium]|nr:hypothetical protein [Solirubrobacteraceae bacterium]
MLVGLAALLFAAPASAADYKVGAATTDTTPPLFHAGDDATDLGPQGAACTPAIYNGPRTFRFEEPYQDNNNNGQFDYKPDPPNPPDAFCDANGNGRWDAIYNSGAAEHLAKYVKADGRPRARAFAISDGTRTTIFVSVTAEGIFQNYTEQMRVAALANLPAAVRDKVSIVVSADHNESSPDTVGINGGFDPGINASAISGIDEYYMSYLTVQVAKAASDAYGALAPANLYARQIAIPPNISVHLSNNFPTTDGLSDKDANAQAAAIDPKIGLLQARGEDGKPIVTVMSLAAHNQEIGHSNDSTTSTTLSADWPGYFERGLDSRLGSGTGIYLVGDNGSEEDPQTIPAVPASAGPGCPNGCFAQAKATGEAFADLIAQEAPKAQRIRSGAIVADRKEFCAPLENNVFKAAAAGGVFGTRQTYTCPNGTPVAAGRTGDQLKTEVDVVDVGPDLQFITNPGEAFPALMVGSPFGIEDSPCTPPDTVDRTNPAIPTWRGHAAYRFQVGLANDMIGYMIPGWAYVEIPGVFPTPCTNDPNTNTDSKGHKHKLETEGVGPTASNRVANESSALLAKRPDPIAQVRLGRYVMPDGKLSRRAAGAVAVWMTDRGSTTLEPGKGSIIAIKGFGGFGSRAIDRTGVFMDYDGADQSAPDITTRGMLTFGCAGAPAARYYLDLYPALTAPASAGAAQTGTPDAGCTFPGGGGGNTGGGGHPLGPPTPPPGCNGANVLHSRVGLRDIRVRRTSLAVRGTAREHGCRVARLTAVTVSISRRLAHHRCRFLQPNGRFDRAGSCRPRTPLLARGTSRWRLGLNTRVPVGRYLLISTAYDAAGRRERAGRHGDVVTFVVRPPRHRHR